MSGDVTPRCPQAHRGRLRAGLAVPALAAVVAAITPAATGPALADVAQGTPTGTVSQQASLADVAQGNPIGTVSQQASLADVAQGTPTGTPVI